MSGSRGRGHLEPRQLGGLGEVLVGLWFRGPKIRPVHRFGGGRGLVARRHGRQIGADAEDGTELDARATPQAVDGVAGQVDSAGAAGHG